MTIEKKRNKVYRYCGGRGSGCGSCKLRVGGWKHETDNTCLSISNADEDELDRALALINGTAPTAPAESVRTFSTGAVRDVGGKGRMDLLPWAAIMEVSKHCENGALKYGEHNIDKGIPTSSLCDSACRHLAKHIDGWTDEPHLLAAAWNLLWAIQMEIKHPELVDVPWKEVKPDVEVNSAEELEQL